MPTADSTPATHEQFIQHIEEYCISMCAYFDLAMGEIEKHNSEDFDGLRFLTEAAKAKLLDFDKKAHAFQVLGEVNHA